MKKHWQALQPYVLYFILYAIIGWLYEVFLEVVVYRWGYSDRGVLFGPWCPVYGVGAMAFLVCVRPLMARREPEWLRRARPFLVFLSTMAVATAIELAASYFLEAVTGGWPWQTYADYAVNFQGRIALSPSLRFGLGGVLFLYVVQPLLERLVGSLPARARSAAAAAVLSVLLADCGATLLKLLLRA
jgi:uncharacterized membrane protein